jgi:16S rRNA (uracil1498-N3)-methyltransferase
VRLFLVDGWTLSRPPAPGDTVALGREESRHLVTVLRAGPGEPIRLADGRGRFLDGVIARAVAAGAAVTVTAVREDPRETRPPRLELACALVKGQHFEWVLEKATELGVHAVRPLLAERGVVRPGPLRRRRWEALLRAATKQAGRAYLPRLHEPIAVAALVSGLSDTRLFYGEEEARRPEDHPAAASPRGLAALGVDDLLARPGPPCATLLWAVGPEGGWSDAERDLLSAAGCAVRLGPHRLRTETAALAGLFVLQGLRERLAPAAS